MGQGRGPFWICLLIPPAVVPDPGKSGRHSLAPQSAHKLAQRPGGVWKWRRQQTEKSWLRLPTEAWGALGPGEALQLICSPIREENMGLSDGVYCLPGTSQGPPWGLVSRVWFFFKLS